MEKVERAQPSSMAARCFPIGAEVLPEGGVSFRVWAPKRLSVQVALTHDPRDPNPSRVIDLEVEERAKGYFSVTVPKAGAGMYYGFRLNGETRAFPDPASRFQPEGPEGLSQVVDFRAFKWSDDRWKGVSIPGQVLYEIHVGTLTPEGTWQAAIARLPEIATAGMTVLEIMPLADFPGGFGWGYDGVCQFARHASMARRTTSGSSSTGHMRSVWA